ncbi:hypothetical protein BOX15_Mlig029281g1 [Macrostomum lignano]|uniref:Caspase family p20 domain-containing protein n=1 Tax=Macrostomum lignano TaxID=282301 RepID=A0A267G898_9PLAT|nr:hypothetical protein BOX15_Mlig029281g1 [Macrostomum lignano]
MSKSEQTEQTPIRLNSNNDSNFQGPLRRHKVASERPQELVDVGRLRSLEELRAEFEATKHNEQQKKTNTAGFLIGNKRKGVSQVKDNHQSLNALEAGQNLVSTETSIAVSIVIENANRNDTSECEHGYKADRGYIRKVAEKLGCTDKPIEYKPGDRSKQELLKFIREKCPLHVARVFLFISSHGNRNGFSTGTEHVRLRELLEPLSRAADEVLTFYHACRGTKEHFVKQEDPALDSGDDGDGEAGDGASLPMELRLNCSVIYSSQSGYVSRWQEKDGSRLLMAVRYVLCFYGYRLFNNNTSIAGLAQKIQKRLNYIDGYGIDHEFNGIIKKCYPRVAYAEKINNANNNKNVTSTNNIDNNIQ